MGSLGGNITIICCYPKEFERQDKLFYKKSGEGFTEVARSSGLQSGRFSISVDRRRSKFFSVTIKNVREDDGGIYFCAGNEQVPYVSYVSFFTEIQLQVAGKTQFTT